MFPEHSRVSVWIHVGWDDFTPKHAPLEKSTSSLGCGAGALYPPLGPLLCSVPRCRSPAGGSASSLTKCEDFLKGGYLQCGPVGVINKTHPGVPTALSLPCYESGWKYPVWPRPGCLEWGHLPTRPPIWELLKGGPPKFPRRGSRANFSSEGTWAGRGAMPSQISRTHSGHVTRFWSGTPEQCGVCTLFVRPLLGLLEAMW